MSALVWSQILRYFVNTFTTGDKYSRPNIQNFPQQFETPLPRKQKTFSGFLIPFLKCALNLEHFEKNDENPCLVFSKIYWLWKKCYLNIWNVLLQNTIR